MADARWSSRLRRWLSPWNLLTLAVLLWAAPRLLPHLGALVGLRSGPDAVPVYAYQTLDGGAVSADSLRGKVVLVNFWATWCAPCRAEMPLLEAMYERHRGAGLVIVGLAVDRVSTDAVAAFVRDRGVTYPIAHVDARAEAVFGGVRGYPTSFLLDRSGRIRHTVMGPIGPLSLEPAVRRLLAEPTNR
ncbi:MAG: TlpA family protein disulfide reductase [Gemmatimonadaceae bacterium]|nr:TlpA family protein disulfide reductase [Gemmatimonadaceae bacterium]